MRSILSLLSVFVFAVAVASPVGNVRAADSGSSSSAAPNEITQARSMLESGKFAEAEDVLWDLLKVDAKSADGWNLLGFATRKQGKFKEAEEYYGNALKLDAKHVGAMEYLGMLYIETGRMDEAKAMLERIDDACFFSCDEYAELKGAIESGKVN